MNDRRCPNCGAVLKAGTNECEYCGTDWTPSPPMTEKIERTSGKAIASFGFSFVGFLLLSEKNNLVPPVLGLVGMILGIISLKINSKAKSKIAGEGLSLVGTILGIVTLLLSFVMIIMNYRGYRLW